MKGFLHQLFDYNFYCNKKLIEHFNQMEHVPEQCMVLFSHILNAHHIWNSRILQKPAKYKVWDQHDVSVWEDMHYENQRTTFEIVTNAEDLNLRIDYENSEGRSYGNELKDMLFHVINHATQHRGQILAELQTNGLETFPLDYIFYKR